MNATMWAPRVLLPGYCDKGIPVPRVFFVPVLQKSQKFRVRVWVSYRTYRNSGCGTEVLQNSEVPGIVARAYRTHVRYKNDIPVPRVLWHLRTELPEVPGAGMNVLQNSQKLFVG